MDNFSQLTFILGITLFFGKSKCLALYGLSGRCITRQEMAVKNY